jgi:hypothetical protein
MTSRAGKRIVSFVVVTALTTTVMAGTFTLSAAANATTSPATGLARELLTQVILPPEAVLAHPSTTVVCQCEDSSGTVTAEHRYYIVPGTPTSVEKFLTSHIPAGGSYDGSVGKSSTNDSPPVLSIAITYRTNGPNLYLKQLAYSMTRRTSSTSWLRVDSQIIWVPSRNKSQMISHPVSAVVTGYKLTALSGSRGNVRVDLAGSALAKLIDKFNALPLGPINNCMEDLGGFSIALSLKGGQHLQIYNGYCAGSFDIVSAPTGNPKFGYQVSDRSCSFMRAVVSLFPGASVPGSRSALHSCEVWSKTLNS